MLQMWLVTNVNKEKHFPICQNIILQFKHREALFIVQPSLPLQTTSLLRSDLLSFQVKKWPNVTLLFVWVKLYEIAEDPRSMWTPLYYWTPHAAQLTLSLAVSQWGMSRFQTALLLICQKSSFKLSAAITTNLQKINQNMWLSFNLPWRFGCT